RDRPSWADASRRTSRRASSESRTPVIVEGRMAEHPNARLARDAFDAMGRGDVDWLQAHMHPDVVFHQGGRFPTAGTYTGRDAVFGHMMEFFALVDFSMKIAVHDIAATDDHAVSLVQVSIDYQGRHLDFDEAHIW